MADPSPAEATVVEGVLGVVVDDEVDVELEVVVSLRRSRTRVRTWLSSSSALLRLHQGAALGLEVELTFPLVELPLVDQPTE